jgi:enoyl-CoA hydratase/carnithine racemase
MAYRNLLVERDGVVAFVTMNRPERRNALSLEHLEELLECFRGIGADPKISVAILRGNGPAFCSGHDLAEMIDRQPADYQRVFGLCTELMETLPAIPQPVVAQVHATATAAGCQLVASCDLAVASSEARFATPGVKIGLFCTTPMVALTRAVGRKKAMEMLLTGEPIGADEALAAGLINRVVPPGELARATRALADRIAAASPAVVALGKRAFYQQIDLARPQAYAAAQQVMCANAVAPDAQEGMTAFLQKRTPKWIGRTSGD